MKNSLRFYFLVFFAISFFSVVVMAQDLPPENFDDFSEEEIYLEEDEYVHHEDFENIEFERLERGEGEWNDSKNRHDEEFFEEGVSGVEDFEFQEKNIDKKFDSHNNGDEGFLDEQSLDSESFLSLEKKLDEKFDPHNNKNEKFFDEKKSQPKNFLENEIDKVDDKKYNENKKFFDEYDLPPEDLEFREKEKNKRLKKRRHKKKHKSEFDKKRTSGEFMPEEKIRDEEFIDDLGSRNSEFYEQKVDERFLQNEDEKFFDEQNLRPEDFYMLQKEDEELRHPAQIPKNNFHKINNPRNFQRIRLDTNSVTNNLNTMEKDSNKDFQKIKLNKPKPKPKSKNKDQKSSNEKNVNETISSDYVDMMKDFRDQEHQLFRAQKDLEAEIKELEQDRENFEQEVFDQKLDKIEQERLDLIERIQSLEQEREDFLTESTEEATEGEQADFWENFSHPTVLSALISAIAIIITTLATLAFRKKK